MTFVAATSTFAERPSASLALTLFRNDRVRMGGRSRSSCRRIALLNSPSNPSTYPRSLVNLSPASFPLAAKYCVTASWPVVQARATDHTNGGKDVPHWAIGRYHSAIPATDRCPTFSVPQRLK